MTPAQYNKMLEVMARRMASEQVIDRRIDFRKGAFPQQITFLEDQFPFKMAHCSRGAAKSYTAGLGIYEFMDKFPGCSCFYVTKTRDMARNIMWGTVMKQIAKDFNIPIAFNETLLEGRYPNSSTFRLTGIDGDSKQQDKLLGGKYKLVVLDEVAFFETSLDTIVYRTLMPAAGRIGGSIWLLSTSSDYPRGLFYEATRPEKELRAKGWNVHEWNWWDNPYIKDEMQGTIDKLIGANPLIIETNHYKQHYLNQWVIDESKLVYRFSAERNLFKNPLPTLPADGWSYVLGVDLGWEDDNAFVLTAHHLNDPHLYILSTYAEKHLTFDQVADKIQAYMSHPIYAPNRVIIDGANKQGVESMRVRSNIPFEYADKLDKATFIELCNADMVQGKIKILDTVDNKQLCKELSELVWETDQDKIKFPKKEHPGLPNHRCDALLYAWRNGFHYHFAPLEKQPAYGSREWYQKQADGIWERERDNLERQNQGGNWPTEPGFGDF